MIEIVFGFSVIAVSLLFAYGSLKASGGGSAPAWFVICGLVFVMFAYQTTAISDSSAANLLGLSVVSLGMLSFMAGSVLGRYLGPSHTSSRPIKVQADYVPDALVDGRRLAVLAIATLGPSWLYFVLLGYVPLFNGLGAVATQGMDGLGELQAARLSRDSYASDSGVRIPGQGFMQIARNIGVPMLAAYSLVLIQVHGRSFSRVAMLVLAVTTVLLAGQRWPLLYVGIALAISISYSNKHFPLKRVAHLGTVVVSIGVGVSILQRRTTDNLNGWGEAVLFALRDLWERVTFDQVLVPLLSYERETYEGGELFGRSYFDSLMAYMPGPGASFPVEFYMRVTGDNRAYTAAPDFFTEAYINFDVIGVVIVSALWGVTLNAVSRTPLATDRSLDVALKSGVISVLALSCFTGPVFTIASIAYATILSFAASLISPRTVSAACPVASLNSVRSERY